MPRAPRIRLRNLAPVAVGGAVGACMRHVVLIALSGHWGVVLVVNVLGSMALGFITAWAERRDPRWWVLPLVGTGALGGFTTFSTVMAQAVSLAAPMALLDLALQVTTCLLGAWIGSVGGRRA